MMIDNNNNNARARLEINGGVLLLSYHSQRTRITIQKKRNHYRQLFAIQVGMQIQIIITCNYHGGGCQVLALAD